MVADLVPAVLRGIDASPELLGRIAELPFEVFVEALTQHSPTDRLLSIFASGSPGTNHRFLAELLRQGEATDICTTNFDLLIEAAGSEIGFEEGRDLAVLHTADSLQSEIWRRPRPRLVKIHGSASHPRDMATTIRQVAGQIYSAPRAGAIEHFFASGAHGCLLVLGYSCSDTFDLSPQIQALAERGKPVYLVEHSGTGDVIEVEPISLRLTKNPFRDYAQGYRIFANTDRFVHYLWNALLPGRAYPVPEVAETPWRDAVGSWAGELPWFSPALIRGSLMGLLGMHDECISEFEALAMRGSEARIPEVVAVGLSNQVESLLRKGDPGRAADLSRRAIATFRERDMPLELGNQLGWLGNCLLDLHRPDEALTHYSESLELLETLGDEPGCGNQHGNIANALFALQRFEEAIAHYERAREIADRTGNVRGLVHQLMGLSTSLLEFGRPAEALPYSLRGESIATATARPREHAHLASLSGTAYQRLGAFHEAVEAYEYAVALAREEGDDARAGIYLREQAAVLIKLGEWDRAIECAHEADQLLRSDEDAEAYTARYLIALAESKRGQVATAEESLRGLLDDPALPRVSAARVRVLCEAANIQINRGSPLAAIALLEEAMDVCNAGALGPDVVGGVRSTFGVASLSVDGPEAARPHMEEALRFALARGDLPDQGHCHEVLANIHVQLGDLARAAEHARTTVAIAESTGRRDLEVWALADLGNIEVLRGHLGPALDYYTRGLELSLDAGFPSGVVVHQRYRGNLFEQVGMDEEAVVELSAARKLLEAVFGVDDPDLPMIDSQLARVRAYADEHRARTYFQVWNEQPAFVHDPGILSSGPAFYAHRLATDPDDQDVAFCCGRFYYRLRRPLDAIAVLRGCRVEGARRVEALNYLGNAFYRAGQPSNALEAFESLLSIEPGHQNARFLAGLCSNDLGRPVESAQHYAWVGREHPHYAYARFNLGMCAIGRNDLDDARRYLEEFLEIEGDDAEVHTALASIYASLGHPEEAQAALEKALAAGADPEQLGPVTAAVDAARVEATCRAERWDLVRANPFAAEPCLAIALDPIRPEANAVFLEEIAEAYPDAGPPRHALALLHHQAGQVEKAIDSYRHALRLTPNLPYLNYHYALILSDALRDYRGSRHHYAVEIQHHPQRIEAHHNLGLLLWKRFGDRDGAEACFLAALRIDPEFPLTVAQMAALREH
ncbi:MAG TPA: tetratricopeptide repeat protein [Longimicrobium sp.]